MIYYRRVNRLKAKKRLIKLNKAHQRSHCKVSYLVLAHEKENAFIIFVHAYANVISIRVKASSRVQNHGRKSHKERRKAI